MTEYFKKGAIVTTAPKPIMGDGLYDQVRPNADFDSLDEHLYIIGIGLNFS